jgi:hypothetical protein
MLQVSSLLLPFFPQYRKHSEGKADASPLIAHRPQFCDTLSRTEAPVMLEDVPQFGFNLELRCRA